MELRKRRKFSKEFKLDVINMVKLGEKSVRELSKELEIQDVTIYSWIRKYKEDKEEAFPGEGKLKSSDEELRKLARESAEQKVSFYTHLAIYITVNIFLIAIWWATSGPSSFPWFVFPLFGWGIGIVAHFVEAFRGSSYTEKLAEKEYQKLKNEIRALPL